jgi:predicted amino acid dehydrogenase
LGAHTSIITGNGLNLAERNNCKILTGNSLTIASCLYHLNQFVDRQKNSVSERNTIAIVGASGNIGSGLVDCLNDPKYAEYEIILISNNEKRLQKIKEKLAGNNRQIESTTDLFELRRANVIVSCANTNDPIIFSHHILNDSPVFIIDISVPSSVSDEVKELENVYFCKEASSVHLPGDQETLFSSHTPNGKLFCCAAESILCALYDLEVPLKGHINVDTVRRLLPLALDEGFLKPTGI